MLRLRSTGACAVTAALAVAVLLCACGSGTATQNGPGGAASGTPAQITAVESAVRDLFSALSSENDAAACQDYTPATRSAIVAAAQKAATESRQPLGSGVTCATALKFITNLTPGSTQATQGLGAPTFSHVEVNGDSAVVTYASKEVGGLTAHSTVTLARSAGRWLAAKATSLTFSHG